MIAAPVHWVGTVLVLLILAVSATDAGAQAIGPVTGKVGADEPTDASIRLGPVTLSSGLAIQSIGIDDNVFDEPVNPKRDWHAIVTPDVTAFVRNGLVRFTLYASSDFTYYKTYSSERGINRTLRGRTDFLFSRLRPFLGGATVNTRERPNAEIDRRAGRSEQEVIGGLNFELSPLTYLFGGATRTDYRVSADEFYRGVSLARQFNRREDAVAFGVRRDLTPLTTMQVIARHSRDRFEHNTLRDSEMTAVQTIWGFAPDALFHGELSAGVQMFDPSNPELEEYRGLTLGGRIDWPILTTTQLRVEMERRLKYSYEEAEGYYIDSGISLTLTQRVFGNVDGQTRGSIRRLAYGQNAPTTGNPSDRVMSVLFGTGYTLGDQSRLGLDYEFTQRDSNRRSDRLFDRHRLYGSWTQRF